MLSGDISGTSQFRYSLILRTDINNLTFGLVSHSDTTEFQATVPPPNTDIFRQAKEW